MKAAVLFERDSLLNFCEPSHSSQTAPHWEHFRLNPSAAFPLARVRGFLSRRQSGFGAGHFAASGPDLPPQGDGAAC